MAETEKKAKTPVRDELIAGAFSGFVARLVTAPFDVYKIRSQLQFDAKRVSMLTGFKEMIANEGFFSLWKGNVSATYLWISYSIVQFGVYDFLKKMGDVMLERMQSMEAHDSRKVFDDRGSTQQKVSKQQAKPSSMQSSRLMKSVVLFLAGSGAGIAATALTYPFDIMRTQFAVQGKDAPYKSMKSFVSSTLKSKGISGFYAGLGPAVIGIAPYMGLNFALYENSKQLLAKLDRYEPEKHSVVMNAVVNTLKQGLCGAFAGGLSKILVYPLDTIKKRMQIQVLKNTLDSVGSMPKYTSAMNCVTRTLQEEGVRGFYRGIVPTVIKSVVATSVTFAAYEGAKDFMEHRRKMNSLHGVKKMSIIHPKM